MRPLVSALRDAQVPRGRVATAVLAGTAALGSAVGLAAVAAWLIARAAELPSPADIALAAVLVRFFGIGRGVFRYAERLASHDTALSSVARLRERVYDRLAATGADRALAMRRGDIVARAGADIDAVGDSIVRAIIPLAVAATVSIGAVIVVTIQLPIAGLALALCLVLAAVVPAALTMQSARIAADDGARARAAVTVAALGAIESAPEHRVWGTTRAAAQELAAADRLDESAHDAAARPTAIASAAQTLFAGLALIAGVTLAIGAISAGDISGPAGAIVALVPLAAFEAVGAVPAAIMQFARSSAAARRLVELEGPASEPTPAVRAEPAPLALTSVRAAWPGMTPTIPVTVTLEPGAALGIVGRSGIGKTTLLRAIAGAHPTYGGVVTYGGTPVGPGHTGSVIALTAEDAHVFGTTVLENLRVARGDVSESQATEALDLVGLSPWVASLPDGLDTPLGSGGDTVSGGERRRLLLARALLSPAPVQLIDEPAEHLDEEGTRALSAAIGHMRAQGRTVVIVTHDYDILDVVDHVISLDEEGEPDGGPAH